MHLQFKKNLLRLKKKKKKERKKNYRKNICMKKNLKYVGDFYLKNAKLASQ